MHDKKIESIRTRVATIIHDPSCPEESRVLLRIVCKNLNRVRDVADDIKPDVGQSLIEPYIDRCAALLDVVAESLADKPRFYHCVSEALSVVFSLYQKQGVS